MATYRTGGSQRVVAGDRLIVRAHHQGQLPRDAEIIQVLGHGGPPYRVRWEDDGHESIVYPGSDVIVERVHHLRARTHQEA